MITWNTTIDGFMAWEPPPGIQATVAPVIRRRSTRDDLRIVLRRSDQPEIASGVMLDRPMSVGRVREVLDRAVAEL